MGRRRSIGALGDDMKYLINQDRFQEALRKKWQYAIMSKMDYYQIINPQCWP